MAPYLQWNNYNRDSEE